MQVPASLTEEPIELPRKMAATAMPAPTMARIRAYSAAEAPDSSFRKETNLVMRTPSVEFHYYCDTCRLGQVEGETCENNFRRPPLAFIKSIPVTSCKY